MVAESFEPELMFLNEARGHHSRSDADNFSAGFSLNNGDFRPCNSVVIGLRFVGCELFHLGEIVTESNPVIRLSTFCQNEEWLLGGGSSSRDESKEQNCD